MIRFSRCRSSSDAILRDTPVWFTVGMKTRKRPGSAMWLVMRAPFFPIGSLAIWISTSCPSFSSSLICGTTCVLAAAEAPSTAPSAASIRSAIGPALRPATLRPLQQPRFRCRTANLGAGIDRTVANRLGFQQRFGFGLRLFEFQLLRFSLFGFQYGFGNCLAIRRRLALRCQFPGATSPTLGLRQLSAAARVSSSSSSKPASSPGSSP